MGFSFTAAPCAAAVPTGSHMGQAVGLTPFIPLSLPQSAYLLIRNGRVSCKFLWQQHTSLGPSALHVPPCNPAPVLPTVLSTQSNPTSTLAWFVRTQPPR